VKNPFAKETNMSKTNNHMFGLDEAAVAYALVAENMIGNDASLINANPAVVPVFVSLLFQSLEISIKHAGVESGLFTIQEARNRQNRSGHGIKELAALAVENLGGNLYNPIIMAMTFSNAGDRSAQFIHKMICGKKLEKTRNAYASRRLGYGEVYEGDFAIIEPIGEWIASVKQTALNLSKTVDILSLWHKSASQSKHFAIWLREQ
jgi:hypothetical protein